MKNESSRGDRTVKMKPQHYDGSDDCEKYLTQFEILVEVNQWNDVTKA